MSANSALSAQVRFNDRRRSSGPQAFTLDSAFHLRVDAEVAGVAASAIVDSGAARTVVDAGFAARTGLATQAGFNVAGVTANLSGRIAENVAIRIGGFAMQGISAGVLDLRRLSAPAERPIDVILGQELFSRTSIDIDFRSNQISFADPGGLRIAADAVATPLRYRVGEMPQCRISLNGGPPIWAGFDIGYNATLLLSPGLARETGALSGRRVSTVASRGVEGTSVNLVSTIESVGMGGVGIRDVPIEAPGRWNSSLQAILGLELLRRFHLVTDYTNNRLWLSPYRELIAEPLPKDRSGIGAMPAREGMRVIHVARNSPAERAGLAVGDCITRIDGELADLSYAITHPRLGTAPKGTVFMLDLAARPGVRLELDDYY